MAVEPCPRLLAYSAVLRRGGIGSVRGGSGAHRPSTSLRSPVLLFRRGGPRRRRKPAVRLLGRGPSRSLGMGSSARARVLAAGRFPVLVVSGANDPVRVRQAGSNA